MSQILVGGQAVFEGVMMRAPGIMSIAVRRKDGSITVYKDLRESAKNVKFFKKPFLRGIMALIQALMLGFKALNYSSAIALSDLEEGNKSLSDSSNTCKSRYSKFLTFVIVIFSIFIGFLFFFFLPLYLTNIFACFYPTILNHNLIFNFIDGIIRIIFLLGYIIGISFIPDIKKIFQYHGAEHKSIFTYEAGLPLTVENAKPFPTLHPRCGTAFLLVVMIIGIIVFTIIPKDSSLWMKAGARLFLLPVIAGISFELIKKAGEGKSKFFTILIKPGLWLQRITTREPSDDQLEVGLKALQVAIDEAQNAEFDFVV